MSFPMFMYGLTAGSIIPLSFVYVLRPESLANLFDFLSSSLLIALNWSDGVAQRFNLSSDLILNASLNLTLPKKMYSCYTIEYWYNIFSSIIYLCFILSFLIFLLNHRLKNAQLFHQNENNNNEQELSEIDFVFYYFCVFFLAMLAILLRIIIEHYLLGRLKPFTIVYLLWYIVSFAIVWLWNR